jgi:HEAT repeat protein
MSPAVHENAMLRFALCALLLSAVGCANRKSSDESGGGGLSAAAMREQVDALLNGYERIPSDEDWKRLGPGALGTLEQIYADPNAFPTRRTRAVASMAQVDNPAAVERLKAILQDDRADPQYRSTAALALGARIGNEAVPSLEPALKDRDTRVREASARAMARLGTPEARRSLEAQLENEQDPLVREVIQRSLTKTEP